MPLPLNFIQQLDKDDLLLAYNNNVVEFFSDNNVGVVDSLKCEITISSPGLAGGLDPVTYEITPDNGNIFKFNYKEAFIQILNQNLFAEEIKVFDVTGAANTMITLDELYSYQSLSVRYKITFTDGSTEHNDHELNVLKGVDNIKNNLKRVLNTATEPFYFLTPFVDVADRKVKVTFWEGYPFDIGYYNHVTSSITVTQASDSSNQAVSFTQKTGRFIITDGSEGLADFITINQGFNSLNLNSTSAFTLELTMISGACGDYIKWMNPYGKWNYWLFNQRSKTEFVTKDSKPLFNDYEGLANNDSPYVSVGKESNEIMALRSANISEDEMYYLKFLFESPKVYLFVGVPDVEMASTDFIEVGIKGQTTLVDDYFRKTFKVSCVLELPKRNTMTL